MAVGAEKAAEVNDVRQLVQMCGERARSVMSRERPCVGGRSLAGAGNGPCGPGSEVSRRALSAVSPPSLSSRSCTWARRSSAAVATQPQLGASLVVEAESPSGAVTLAASASPTSTVLLAGVAARRSESARRG